MYPSSIRRLIECLKDLPGIGEKSAERLAYSIVGFDKENVLLAESLEKLVNCKNEHYNRRICNKEFLNLWIRKPK